VVDVLLRGRLIVWNAASGKLVADHAYPRSLTHTTPHGIIDAGPGLDWLPDGSGWLASGDTVIDRESGQAVGSLSQAGQNLPRSVRKPLSRDRVLAVVGKSQATTLQTIAPGPAGQHACADVTRASRGARKTVRTRTTRQLTLACRPMLDGDRPQGGAEMAVRLAAAIAVLAGMLAAAARAEELPAFAPEVPLAPATPDSAVEHPGPVWNLFAAIDASRQPQDLGVNANFGAYGAANAGLPLVPEWNLGIQAGMGGGLSRAGVKVLRVVEGTRARQQLFGTTALFQRGDGWHWAVGYDLQYSSYFDQFTTGQFRGEAGVAVTENYEFGLWGALRSLSARVQFDDATNFEANPLSQVAFYVERRWEHEARTRMWLGVAESHGTDILVLPDANSSGPVLTFGLEVFIPLNDHVVLFGQGNFITPSDTGTLDAYLGLAWYPGGGAYAARTATCAPVLPVASNPTMALDLRRR
jgi:hypothetical protein